MSEERPPERIAPRFDLSKLDVVVVKDKIYLSFEALIETLETTTNLLDQTSINIVNTYKNAGFEMAGKLFNQATAVNDLRVLLQDILEQKQFEEATKLLGETE